MTQWTESLWGDEGFSALAVMKSFPETMGIVMRDTSPPWFYITGWSWVQIFGGSEVALRTLTLLLMIGAAVFAGLTVYAVGKNKVNAIVAGLLAFGAPFLVPFAFEWRMYALLCFSVMGSVYFFMARKWVWFIILSLSAMLTHHFGLFTVAAEGMVLAVRLGKIIFSDKVDGGRIKALLAGIWPFVLLFILYLPGLYLTYLQTSRVQDSGFWLQVPTVGDVTDTLYRFFTGGIKQEWRMAVALGGLTLLAVKDWKKVWNAWGVLLFIYIAPAAMAIVVSYLVTPIFYDRYLLSMVMGMMVLLVVGTRDYYWPIAGVMAVAFWWQSYVQFTNPSKKDFRAFAAEVAPMVTDQDHLITVQGREHHLWESKYYGIPAQIWTDGGDLPLFVGTAQMTKEDIAKELPVVKNGRLGLITSDPVENFDLPGYKLIEVIQRGELRLGWYELE